jgi:hypothetical protein
MVLLGIIGERPWEWGGGGGNSFTLIPAGTWTSYRPVRSLIHVYVLYNFILLYYRREIRWYICVKEKATANCYATGNFINSFCCYMNIFQYPNLYNCWFRWPRDLKRESAAARLLELRVRISPRAWKFVFCERWVLSGRGLSVRLITYWAGLLSVIAKLR